MRFRDDSGEPVAAPREWAPYYLDLEEVDADRWDRAEVAVNGEPLPVALRRLGGRRRVVAEWPRMGAGRYRVRVHDGKNAREREVELAPAKFGEGAFARLLDDLQARLPHSIVLNLARTGAPLGGVRHDTLRERSWENELELLRRAIHGVPGRPGLPALLERIAADPHKTLDAVDRRVHTARARRPGVDALRRALRTSREALDDDGLPLAIDDRRVVVSYDTPENRLVRAVCDQVRLRLHRLRAVGGALGAEVCAELDDVFQRFDRPVRAAAFLNYVSKLQGGPGRPSMVTMRDPRYRAVHRIWQDLTRQLLVTLDEPGLDVPLRNVPLLYERWVTLIAVDALLQAAEAAGWAIRSQRLIQRQPDGIYVRLLRDGVSVLELRNPRSGASASLVPQRAFAADIGVSRSASLRQVPDLTLEVDHGDGGQPRLLLLDPKYKLDGEFGDEAEVTPKKIDIDKMHAYRDAIVHGPERERIVNFAAIVYPGPECRYHRVAALSGRPEQARELHAGLYTLFQMALRP
jgi:hypothetical protein